MYDDENQVDFKSLKYVLYARKSTDDPQRQLRSIPDQIDECKKLAERLGLNIIDILEEKKSAKIPRRRPVFDSMIQAIEKGQYDAILAWHPDRLARNALEAGVLIEMVDEEIIQDLKFVTHHFSPDANGKMLLGMAFVLSKQYSDKLSQDVTRGVRRRHREGKTPIFKHGYLRDENGIYRPDGEKFDLIKDAWLMRANNQSLEEVAKYLNENNYFRLIKGEKSKNYLAKQYMTTQKLSNMFKDPFYFGLLVQAKQEVDLCEMQEDFVAMISRDLYDKVQSLSLKRPNPYKTKHENFYPLKQMIDCAYCGGNMVVGPSSGRKENYLYYRCDTASCVRNTTENKSKLRGDPTKIKASIRAKIIFDFIYDFLKDGLKLTEKEYKEYYQGLKTLGDNELQKIRSQIASYQGQRRHLQTEIRRIALSLPRIRDDETVYQINKEELETNKRDLTQIEASMEKLKAKLVDKDDDELTLEEFLNISKNAAMTVKAGDAIVKDTICRIIFLNIAVDDEKVASYRLKEPFNTLLKSKTSQYGRGKRT